jgi:NADPH:quinone reductase
VLAWTKAEAGSLTISDVAEPEPPADSAVIAVEAFSPNRGESFVIEGAEPGFRPGKDIAGRVVRSAASGRGPAVGSRVVAHLESGGWAERASVPIDRLALIPEAISSVEAAALPMAGLTALRLTRVTGALASRRLLMTGASGGVGHFFVELAASQGAEITVVAATAARSRRLLELGASHWVADPAEATGRFDIGLDSVGGSTTTAVLRKLTNDGLLIWFGQASRIPPTLDFFDWTAGSSATIRKFLYSDGHTPVAKDLATVVRLTAAGRLHPEIGSAFDWRETPQAIEAMLERKVRGNTILTIPSSHVDAQKGTHP